MWFRWRELSIRCSSDVFVSKEFEWSCIHFSEFNRWMKREMMFRLFYLYECQKQNERGRERDRLFRPMRMVITFFFSLFISCVRLRSAVRFPLLYIEMQWIQILRTLKIYRFIVEFSIKFRFDTILLSFWKSSEACPHVKLFYWSI